MVVAFVVVACVVVVSALVVVVRSQVFTTFVEVMMMIAWAFMGAVMGFAGIGSKRDGKATHHPEGLTQLPTVGVGIDRHPPQHTGEQAFANPETYVHRGGHPVAARLFNFSHVMFFGSHAEDSLHGGTDHEPGHGSNHNAQSIAVAIAHLEAIAVLVKGNAGPQGNAQRDNLVDVLGVVQADGGRVRTQSHVQEGGWGRSARKQPGISRIDVDRFKELSGRESQRGMGHHTGAVPTDAPERPQVVAKTDGNIPQTAGPRDIVVFASFVSEVADGKTNVGRQTIAECVTNLKGRDERLQRLIDHGIHGFGAFVQCAVVGIHECQAQLG